MQKWEYKYVHIMSTDAEVRERILNSLGAEGWELIFWSMDLTFIFKRPMQDSDAPEQK